MLYVFDNVVAQASNVSKLYYCKLNALVNHLHFEPVSSAKVCKALQARDTKMFAGPNNLDPSYL
jgi:hypothetical protein